MSEVLTVSQVKRLFPKRDENANKGDFGNIALIGGCVKYSGAIRLADMANAAMRSGAGVCTIAVPSSISKEIIPDILESTIYPLSESDGYIKFEEKEFKELMQKNSVIAFGMGIGDTDETRKSLEYLIKNYEGILIVDADGINAMAKMGKKTLCSHKCKLILTPHAKEFSRLSKRSVADVLADPEGSAMKLADFLNAIVLLKGHVTTISNGELTYRVEKGCPGMATAGSGDVLSGITAAVVANNKDSLLLATAGAAYINGVAGQLASEEHGETSQVASDTAKAIPEAIAAIIEDIDDDLISGKNFVLATKNKAIGEVKRNKTPLMMVGIIAIALCLIGLGFTMHEVLNVPSLFEESNTKSHADDYVLKMEFLTKDIYIDGHLVNNYTLSRPITCVGDEYYIPLTDEICSALGLKASWQGRHPTDIYIERVEAGHAGAFYDVHGWNLKEVTGWAKAGVTVHLVNGTVEDTLTPAASGVVSFNDGEVIYVPIKYFVDSTNFSITTYFDEYAGLFISTDNQIKAAEYFSGCKNNIAFITARAEYIQSFLTDLTVEDCLYYEYIFRHEANVTGVDEDLIISVARTESRFNKYAVSGAGALGMMQIMPDTAKYQDIPLEDLFKVHESIQFGANYIKGAIATQKGDVVRALSAYNFGGGAVDSGQYDTYYANTVLSRMNEMQAQFTAKGYSNKFLTKIESR